MFSLKPRHKAFASGCRGFVEEEQRKDEKQAAEQGPTLTCAYSLLSQVQHHAETTARPEGKEHKDDIQRPERIVGEPVGSTIGNLTVTGLPTTSTQILAALVPTCRSQLVVPTSGFAHQ